jgi:hypothetical protein
MKRVYFFLVTLILLSSFVLAEQQNISKSRTGMESPELNESEKHVSQNNVKIQQRLKAKNSTELNQMIQQRQEQMNQELELNKSKEKIYKNQNRVRLAVHSLLAMEDLVGGIGPQIRDIARDFNNSVKLTLASEEKIQARGRFKRFFAGGDAEAAEALEEEVIRNRERIQELMLLEEQCECGGEVREIMQEQIQSMDEEQIRLQQLAQEEKKSKGLFGWMWK